VGHRFSIAFFFVLAVVVVGGCVEKVTADENERVLPPPPPVAEFDPQNKIIPFPNDLLIDPVSGRVSIPAQCGETPSAAALRTDVLNQLDGFGTSKTAIQATFSQPVDPASLEGRVFVLRMSTAGVPADGSEGPVPLTIVPGKTTQSSVDCQKQIMVDEVTFVPQTPLVGSSEYAVVLLQGIKTTSGADFQPSPTFVLIRGPIDPVEVTSMGVVRNLTPFDPSDPAGRAAIEGVNQLWKAEAPVLTFLDATLPRLNPPVMTAPDRSEMLLAWSFRTQTIAGPFVSQVHGSPASFLTSAMVPDAPQIAMTVPADQVDAFYTANLGAGSCALLGCDAIGTIIVGGFASPNFQTLDDCKPENMTPPGPWSDPLTPTFVCVRTIPFIAVVPKAAPAATGYKTVIFAHGITRTKGDVLALAGRLAAQGIAAIAIDAVAHGDRAKRTSMSADTGCAAPGMGNSCTTAITPSCAPQCYAPFLSPDLATTRDNIRQTVIDTLKVERVLGACATQGACQTLLVDAAHVGYLGQSLGSLIGAVTVAVSPNIKTAVFANGAADWVQIFTFTQSVGIRCSLLDALIDAGVLMGAKSNMGTNPNALCLDPNFAWRQDPGYLAFASTARWVLDPADGVNYAAAYRAPMGPKVLLQEVIGDAVIPNEATDPWGALLGLMKTPAGVATMAMPMPTPAAAMPGSSWIQYKTLPADAATGFPGNTYAHGSLLAPATPDTAGLLGTAQMQTDAITYLVTHL
jgi:dienelactone hydrolase